MSLKKASDSLELIKQKEKELADLVNEKEDAANKAIAELHEAIEELYLLRKGTRVGLNDLQTFTDKIYEKIVKIDVPGLAHKKQQILDALGSIQWYIHSAETLINDFENEVKKISE